MLVINPVCRGTNRSPECEGMRDLDRREEVVELAGDDLIHVETE